MYILETLDKIKKIISFYKKDKKIDISLTPLLYFCTWERNTSYFYFKYVTENKIKYIIFFYYYLIKEFFSLNKYYYNIKNINSDHSNFLNKKIEIFWSDNISRKSKIFNRYTYEIYKKSVFYILIGPKKEKLCNTFFIQIKKISFLEIIRYIIKNKYFSIKKFIHYLNSYSILAIEFKNIILFMLKKSYSKQISIVYEGQPFQNYFIKHIKDRYSCIVIGLLQNFNPTPYNLIVKDKASIPDKLIVYTLDQKYHLVNFFGWDKNSVILKKNFHKYKKKIKYKNIIFIPFFINNSKIYTENLKFFMQSLSLEIIKSFTIKNHPMMKNSTKHISLILEIKNIINLLLKEKNNTLKSEKNFYYNIFLGTSSGIVESLHIKNVRTIQIFSDANTDIYYQEFWPSIDRTFFNDNTIIYKKKRRFLF